MSLNPNAPPWNAPEYGMEHPGLHGQHPQQDPGFHGYGGYYQGPPMQQMSGMVMPRQMMNHGYGHTPGHMHPVAHGGPGMQPFNPGRVRSPAFTPNYMSNKVQPICAPSYKKHHPLVVLVLGYRRVGKTSVAKRIAEARNYKYVSLKPKDDTGSVSPASLVAPLLDLLAHKGAHEGIVIDDVVVQNRFEPYYVQSVLQKHGLKFDVAVVLDNELENTKERGVDYCDVQQRRLHPESYEFCACHLKGEPTVVVECRGKTLDETISDALRQMQEVNTVKESTLTLNDVELMPKCTLVHNPTLATEVMAAQRRALGPAGTACFPFSEPNYLLEYAIFARQAFAFRSYMITPWIQGDKVTLIGYQEAVYVHLPACNVLFHLKDCPAVLTRLAKDTVAKSGVSFIFEATFAANKLYLSDLLLLGEMEGAHMLVNERVDVMREKLGELKGGVVQLLPWYPVNAMERCVKENQEAGGILFINPDGVLLGEYDSRNYLYPLHRKKTVELRIWNGNFTGGKWTFEAYCTEAGSEKLVEGIHVHISDADVNAHCINDGNILECGLEDQHVGPSKGRKSSKHYVFKRRCMWTFRPTTMYKQEFFLSDPKWTKDRVGQACTTVTYIPAARPQVQDSASG